MLPRFFLAIALLACGSAYCQVGTHDPDSTNNSATESPLQVPPPVSSQAYSSTFTGAVESNYLRGGVTFGSAYLSNVNGGANPVSDVSYSIWPTLAVEKTTERLHLWLDYAPGFTLYHHTTSLNQGDQNVQFNLQYRLSQNLTAIVSEGFQKTSNFFNQPNPLSAIPVSGAVPVNNVAIIVPAADTVNNASELQLTYRVGENGILGASGTYGALSYDNSDHIEGLYNSRSAGGSFFYSTRLHENYYVGASYRYQDSLSFQSQTPSIGTKTQTVFLFFTAYLRPTLSFSLSGGPQHYTASQGTLAQSSAWHPMITASMNWNGERTSLSGSYSHMVSGGGGLNGAFQSNNADVSFAWRATRKWTAGASGGYSIYDNLTPSFLFSSSGGHMLSGTASLQRSLGEHAQIQFGYNWTHQDYSGVEAISGNPNFSRVFVNVSYTFSRSLGE